MAKSVERDEFDDIAQQRGPVGVHRAPKRWWSTLLAILLTFAIGGAVAYGVATYLWNTETGLTEEPNPSPSTIEPPEPSFSPSPSPSPSPEPEPEPEPVVNFGVSISVLNGAGVAGLAGREQAELQAAGFTAATPGNLTSGRPDVNTVMYVSAENADTAARVAEVLGIATVQMGATPGSVPIAVLLVTDPNG